MFRKLTYSLNVSVNLRVVTSSEAVSPLHFLIVVNPDWACCFLFKKEADIFTKMRGRLSDGCACVVQNTSIV